ncbi:hypothetical protein SRB5_47280 [Streptomyces sp. RB5]|uniref:N-acetyltransferase domain-containing protein n=1 Tax=Streptomyces smaragdinus TaxID=2585196 RepID=A0A7K0CM56_9ACTN|nr:GNAT family N-acetyltransferase [Streptomyces smaragdinus]MQY14560.1 hypothetical protein [Streptomyces smaragdinus]
MSAFPSGVELAGEDLVLREWTDADLPVLRTLMDDPDVAYWTPLVSPFDEAAARAYLTRSRGYRAEGRTIQLAITRGGGEPLGEVLIMRSRHEGQDPGTLEIGYSVGAAHRGQGLASRAVRVVAAYAFAELGAPSLVLELESENAGSVGVARSSGFRLLDVPLIEGTEKGRSFALQTWGRDRP